MPPAISNFKASALSTYCFVAACKFAVGSLASVSVPVSVTLPLLSTAISSWLSMPNAARLNTLTSVVNAYTLISSFNKGATPNVMLPFAAIL